MTATAGFLSAATGAIVALNQTGVIDLKKMSGSQPPHQSAPLVSPAITATAPSYHAVTPASEPDDTDKKPAEPSPATSSDKATAPSKPAESPPASVAEVKPQSPTPSQPATSSTEAERLKAIQEGAAASAKKEETQAPSATPITAKRDVPESSSLPRVADSATQPVKPQPSPTRLETAPIVKAPPPTPEKKTGTEPVAPGRISERAPERGPAVDDPARPKIVRPPSDAVASRTGVKKQIDGVEPGGLRPTPAPVRETGSAGGSRQLDLAGLKMIIPPGWVKEEVQSGPLAPVAALRITDPAGDGVVQITRHLGAHGKDTEERAIERWLGQVTKPNGASSTMADAKIERRQTGTVRITTVDLAGTVKTTSREAGMPGGRMVAAMVDHPAGPHLITIVGPARSMAKWESAIDGFLRSITPE